MQKLKLAGVALVLACVNLLPIHQPAYAQGDAPVLPEPLVVLIEFDPLIRNEIVQNPTFALYEDGTVVYRNEYVAPAPTEEPADALPDTGYRTLKLEATALAELLATLNFTEFDELRHFYHEATERQHMENYLAMWSASEFKSVWVDGDLRNDEAIRELTPAAYVTAFDHLIDFVQAEHAEAEMWLPTELEIRTYRNTSLPPDSRVVSPGLAWPTDWPDADDPVFHPVGSGAVIILESSQYTAVLDFLAASKNSAEIEGVTYFVLLALPFPNAREWYADIYQAY